MQAIPSEFLAIDRKARAYIPYIDVELRDPIERICDFEDAVISLDTETAMEAASRCVHCPDPAACVTACPAHNDIPSAMWLIEQGQFLEAAKLYRQTSSMPEICGRVCPHEQLCQGSCVRIPPRAGADRRSGSLCHRLRSQRRRCRRPGRRAYREESGDCRRWSGRNGLR